MIAFIHTKRNKLDVWLNVNEIMEINPNEEASAIRMSDGHVVLSDESVDVILMSIKEVMS